MLRAVSVLVGGLAPDSCLGDLISMLGWGILPQPYELRGCPATPVPLLNSHSSYGCPWRQPPELWLATAHTVASRRQPYELGGLKSPQVASLDTVASRGNRVGSGGDYVTPLEEATAASRRQPYDLLGMAKGHPLAWVARPPMIGGRDH